METTTTTTTGKSQIQCMIDACASGNVEEVLRLLSVEAAARENVHDVDVDVDVDVGSCATRQELVTGKSPLMAAAGAGHVEVCRILLERGAPWNAVDRAGRCAGNYASDGGHQATVDLLVEAAVTAELVLGEAQREMARAIPTSTSPSTLDGDVDVGRGRNPASLSASESASSSSSPSKRQRRPLGEEPCTKPEYLSDVNGVRYTDDGNSLLDGDDDAVMMEWERPLMRAHASLLTEGFAVSKSSPTPTSTSTSQQRPSRRILNVGFGMGIVDTYLQELGEPDLHVIIEAHPNVYRHMRNSGWGDDDDDNNDDHNNPTNAPGKKYRNVRICFGRWQDQIPLLLEEGLVFDAIFFDTYGEHYTDLQDFHELITTPSTTVSVGEGELRPPLLAQPHGVYSFFNGLAPDNIFFHGVACECVKLQLARLGLTTDFVPCQIQVDEHVWSKVRRKYWHGDTYYLPISKWATDTS